MPAHVDLDKIPELEFTLAEFAELPEYSTSYPTGTTEGKVWKRYVYKGPLAGRWLACEFVEIGMPYIIGVSSYLIKIKE